MENLSNIHHTMDLSSLSSFFTQAVILINSSTKPVIKIKVDEELKEIMTNLDEQLKGHTKNG